MPKPTPKPPATKDTTPTQTPVQIMLDQSGWKDLSVKEDPQPSKDLKNLLRQRFSDTNVACLIGSGVSIGEGGPSMGDLWTVIQNVDGFDKAIEATGYKGDDIEAFLTFCQMSQELGGNLDELAGFVQRAEIRITEECRGFKVNSPDLDDHVRLLRQLAKSNNGFNRPIVFTTNYDLLIERAAARASLPIIDGFTSHPPYWFDGRSFDIDFVRKVPNQREPAFVEGVFHYCKLHGSVNWASREGEVCRQQTDKGIMIYPRNSKFQASYQQPFLEMMSRFQGFLRKPNATLFVVGFGFNDDHLSEPIVAALRTNPQFNLVVATRSLRKHAGMNGSATTSPNKYLAKLGQAVQGGLGTVALIDADFNQFAALIPTMQQQTDEQKFVELARQVLPPMLGGTA